MYLSVHIISTRMNWWALTMCITYTSFFMRAHNIRIYTYLFVTRNICSYKRKLVGPTDFQFRDATTREKLFSRVCFLYINTYYTNIYIFMYIHTYLYIYSCVYTYIYIYSIYIHNYIYMCTNINIFIFMYIHVYGYIYTYIVYFHISYCVCKHNSRE